LRLPPVAGHCPTGKTVIFNFDADGITKCVEALYNHNDYVKTPFKKRLLPANFVKNMRGTKA
jgi:hypothetical protein